MRMTRTYALRRVLEHGVMGRDELLACCGWPESVLESAIRRCLASGCIRRVVDGAGYGRLGYRAVS